MVNDKKKKKKNKKKNNNNNKNFIFLRLSGDVVIEVSVETCTMV